MSFLVVAVLSLLWLVFFLPSFLQTRQHSSPYLSATTFQESLRRLGEPTPSTANGQPRTGRRTPAQQRKSRVAARRRDVLAGLSGFVVLSALLAVSVGGAAVWAPVPATAALVGYVVVLRARVVSQRRTGRVASTPVAQPQVPAPAAQDDVDGEIVPSVRRRGVDGAAPSQPEPLERIAG